MCYHISAITNARKKEGGTYVGRRNERSGAARRDARGRVRRGGCRRRDDRGRGGGSGGALAQKGLLGQSGQLVRDHEERIVFPHGDRGGTYDLHGDGLYPHGQRGHVFRCHPRQQRSLRRGLYRDLYRRDNRHDADGVFGAYAAGAGVGNGHQRLYRLYAFE